MHRFMVSLQEIDALFCGWEGPTGRKYYDMPISKSLMRKWIAQGIHRAEEDGRPVPDAGFMCALLAKEGSAYLVLRVICGGYSPWLNNCCVMEFPTDDVILNRIVNVDTLLSIARSVLLAWEPDHGRITSSACLGVIPRTDFFAEVGWITYVSRKYGEIPAVLDATRVEEVNDGTLIVASEERLSCNNPEHVKILERLTKSLDLATRFRKWYRPPDSGRPKARRKGKGKEGGKEGHS
jgi:hypothetical protein